MPKVEGREHCYQGKKSLVIRQGRSRGLRVTTEVGSFGQRPKSDRSVEREILQVAKVKREHPDTEDWEAL